MRKVAEALELNPVEEIFDWQDENERLLKEELFEKQIGGFNQDGRTFKKGKSVGLEPPM
jgi:hypothetical protein